MSGNIDLDVRTPQPFPVSAVPIADPKTGLVTPAWSRIFRQFWYATGMQGGTFRGMPKIRTQAIPSTGPGGFGSATISFPTPFPNFAEFVMVSSSNTSMIVAARALTLSDFLLAWNNNSASATITDAVATWAVWGG